jgi:hypothetical protein
MLSKLFKRCLFSYSTGHSFYSPNILEYPINTEEEGYAKNQKMMKDVTNKYKTILENVITILIT